MAEQLGLRGFTRRLSKEASSWGMMLPQFPRLMHQALSEVRVKGLEQKMDALLVEKRRQNRLLAILVVLLTLAALWQIW
jgi:ubiquinone biosynthesis protein